MSTSEGRAKETERERERERDAPWPKAPPPPWSEGEERRHGGEKGVLRSLGRDGRSMRGEERIFLHFIST